MATNNATNTSNPATVPQGGTGLTTLTAHSIQIGNGTSSPTQLAVGATSTMLTGVTASDPAFSATPAVTSITLSGGTALSNYTEGTFTPTLDGATPGTTTYSGQFGYYRRIGNLVALQVRITLSAATGTGNVVLGGLPFTIKNQTNGTVIGPQLFSSAGFPWPAGCTTVNVKGIINTTTAQVACYGSATAEAFMQMANAALTCQYSLTYEI